MKTLLSLSIALALTGGFAAAARAQDAKPGDSAAGEKKVDMCIGCHGIKGYQASFPQVHRVPMISGQNAKYITAALNGYRKGERKHPTMRAIAATLTDQDIADVAAYYSQQGMNGASAVPDAPPAPSAEVTALLTKGNCVSCHGANFNKPVDPSYPKIAGQYSDYLYVALRAYQLDKNPQAGRSNAIMSGMVKPYTTKELKQLADYISSLPGDVKTIEQERFRLGE